MRNRIVLATLCLVLAVTGCATSNGASTGPSEVIPATVALDPVSSPDWAADMARFAAEDAIQPPPPHTIVFVGSSSIRLWQSLATDFPGKPVLNRGFGGSQLRDAVWFADQAVIHYRPRQIVLYAGDNDIDAKRSPVRVAADFHAFVMRVRRDLPTTPILYLSIKPSLARRDQLPMQRAANALIKAQATQMPNVTFIDVATPMLDAGGEPRPELFIADGLHMTRAGYAIWTAVLAPYLR